MNKFFANFFFFFFSKPYFRKNRNLPRSNLIYHLNCSNRYAYTLTSVTSKTNCCFCQIGGHKGLWDPILDESHDGFEWVKKEWREGDGTRVPAYV